MTPELLQPETLALQPRLVWTLVCLHREKESAASQVRAQASGTAVEAEGVEVRYRDIDRKLP